MTMNSHNPHSHQVPQLRPLTKSSEYLANCFRPFRKLLAICAFILIFEACFGHPTLRMTWRGTSSDPTSAYYCELVTFPFGERKYYRHYKPLITVVKPELTIREWLIQQAKNALR